VQNSGVAMREIFNIATMVCHNMYDSNIQAYTLVITNEYDKVLYDASGLLYSPPAFAMLKSIHRGIKWASLHSKEGYKVDIYCSRPAYVLTPLIPNLLNPNEGTIVLAKKLKDDIYEHFKHYELVSLEKFSHPFLLQHRLTQQYETMPTLENVTYPEEAFISPPHGFLTGEKIFWNERLCGYISNRRYISFREPKHYCYKHQGWGIQREIVDLLESRAVKTIEILCRAEDWQKLYLISMEDFLSYSRCDVLNPTDGEQLFVSDMHFTVHVFGGDRQTVLCETVTKL